MGRLKISARPVRKNAGLTLVELIIVLAIIAIIGAIVIPNFLTTTDRARLRSDIASAQVLQNAIHLHSTEHPSAIPAGASMQQALDALEAAGHITARQRAPQTAGAIFVLANDRTVRVDIAGATPEIRAMARTQLSPQEQAQLINPTAP